MIGLVLVFVTLLGASQLGSAVPVGTCPAQDPLEYTVHLPDSSDCTIFYKCDHGGPVLFHCPDGLHFNPTLSVCDWPQNAGCYANGGDGSTAPPDVTPCPAIGTCPEYDSPDDIVKLLPHADNCTLYCRCDHGVPITMPCAPGTWFNPTLEVCDWPEDSGCISGGSTTKPPTKSTPTSGTSEPTSSPSSPSTTAPLCPAIGTCPEYDSPDDIVKLLPHADNCTLYCRCDHGVPITMPCAPGTWFNPTLEVCDWPENAGCISGGSTTQPPTKSTPTSGTSDPTNTPSTKPSTTAPLCPAIGTCPEYDSPDDIVKLLPHADNCTLYCRCDHGVPITMSCGPGTWFNPVLEVCDWPENAGCISGGSTTQPPTKSTPTSGTSDPTNSPPTKPSTTAPLCPAIGTCPEYDSPDDIVKLLPHADNCTLYCRCDHGVPITMSCGPGTWFNPVLEVCDWPENAGCISGGSTTQPPTKSTPTSGTSDPTNTPSTKPSTTAPLCPAIGTCPEYDSPDDIVKLLPHADNCTLYCRCDHGVPITMSCGPGTWFNPVLEVCDWPENAGCISGGSTTQPPTKSTPTTGTSGPTSSPSTKPSTTAPLCPAIGTCPEYDSPDDIVKLLPHADNCTLYCRCDHGVPITMPCPEGTWFNPTLEICDWPQNAGCISGGSTTQAPSSSTQAPSSSTQAPSSSTQAPSSSTQAPSSSTQAPSSSTQAPSSSTQAPSSSSVAPEGNCDAVGTCPEYDQDSIVVHLPSRTDCTIYCRCDHGVPIKMPCPDGLYFNPKLEVCDWPQDAGCTAENARK